MLSAFSFFSTASALACSASIFCFEITAASASVSGVTEFALDIIVSALAISVSASDISVSADVISVSASEFSCSDSCLLDDASSVLSQLPDS